MNSYAQTTYDWLGTGAPGNRQDWTNVKNWRSTTGGVTTNPATTYPGQSGSTDIVNIGVNVTFHAVGLQPVINTGATINIASLNMGDNMVTVGNQWSIILTINGTLNITGAFTQMHSTVGTAGSGNTAVTRPIQNYLIGSGTMTCGSIVMGDNTVPAASNVVNATGFKMGSNGAGGSTLTVIDNGDFILNSPGSKDASNNILSESFSEFSFAAGTLSITGQIKITDIAAPYVVPSPSVIYTPLAWFSMDLFANADSPVLNLYNASPLSIQTGNNRNSVDFYNINASGGTGTSTVNYAGTGATQDIPVYKNNGTVYSFVETNPSVYQNVTFSGAGTKSVSASASSGTFSVAGNFTLAAGTETVNVSTNTPILTIGGNYSSASGTNLIKSDAAALTIPGTTTNGGTFTHSGGAAITFTGAFTNTATGIYNQTGSGTVTASSTTSNAGTYNQSGTALATFTGAVTNTGTINQTNTGNILFSAAFTNSGSGSVLSQTGGATINFANTASNDGTITQNNASGIFNFNNTFSNTLSGSKFTLTTGTSNFLNSYSNSGTFRQTGGTVNFNQPTSQSLTDNSTSSPGTSLTAAFGGTTFSNVNMKNGGTIAMSGTGRFYISDAGFLNMSNNTTLAAGGVLTLISDASGSATVPAIPTGCSITGNVTVQRYISANRAYRLISSPVFAGNDGTNNYYSVNYLLTNSVVTGDGGGPFSKAGNPTLYLWRENIVPQNTSFFSGNFRGVANISSPASYGMDDAAYPTTNIPVGNGYLFYYRGSIKQASLAALTTAGAAATTDTLNATGTLNQGNITVHDWYTPASANLGWTTTNAGNASIQGINLVGNPYASAIDWDKIDSVSSAGAIYTQNVAPFSYQLVPSGLQGSGNYNVYRAGSGGIGTQGTANSNIIPSGEGFLIQAENASASITFSEAAKLNTVVTGSSLYLAKKIPSVTQPQFLRLQLSMDSINTDGTIISFVANAKTSFNKAEDAHYHSGTGKVNLASLSSDNQPLAINQLPLALKGDTIKLKVGATASGNYTLNLKSITGIPQIYDVWLKDAHTKDSVNLRTTATYSFTIKTTDTSTFGSNRFSLVIVQDPDLAYKLLSFDAAKAGNNDKQVQVTWKSINEQNYTHFTVERSNDNGKTFDVIGGMLSSNAGTYSLLDKSPLKGANLYRLKQLDFNDNITYSSVVEVAFNGNNNITGHLSCYPNPAFTVIHLSFDPKDPGKTSYDVKVTNSSGMIVRFAVITEPNWQASVSNLLTGTYLIQVTDKKDGSVIGQTKFVKL